MAKIYKNLPKKAFTLVEVLIGVIIMTMVIGGIAMCVRFGVDMHLRTEASSLITNGVRFSIVSFEEDIMPQVSNSGYIKILKQMPPEDSITSEDAFVYLDSGSVVCRTGSTKEALHGSDNVTSLQFSLPVSTVNSPDNYMLTMTIAGKSAKYPSMSAGTDVKLALFNRQKKEFGDDVTITGGVAVGPILQFSPFKFANFKVIDIDNSNKVIANNEAVEKGHRLRITYEINVPADRVDATKILWYASASSISNQQKGIGYWKEQGSETAVNPATTKSYSGDNVNDMWWPLLIKKGSDYYLASESYKKSGSTTAQYLDIPTNGNANDYTTKDTTLYVYTGPNIFGDNSVFESTGKLKAGHTGSVAAYGKYAYLRAWVVPAYSDEDGTNIVMPLGYQQWGSRVRLQKTQRLGERFFNYWAMDIEAKGEAGYTAKDDYWYDSGTGSYNLTGKYDTTAGESHVTLKTTGNGGKNGPRIAAVLTPNDLGDARKYEKYLNGSMSFTCTTNYSVIIDGIYGSGTAGLSVLLNGYKKDDSSDPVGYAHYYDPGAMGYPIRFLKEGGGVGTTYAYQANGVYDMESPLQSDINQSVSNGSISGGNSGTFYTNFFNPQYTNSALLNSTFITMKCTNPSTGSQKYAVPPESTSVTLRNVTANGSMVAADTDESQYMQTRRRYMLTVLEYYLNDDELTPRLLVRLKLLKTLDEVLAKYPAMDEESLRAEDPFLCGPKFYASEPAWYGSFVGQTPKVTNNSPSNGNITYTFKAMRDSITSTFDRIYKKSNSDTKYTDSSGYYAVQAPDDGNATNLKTRRYSAGYATTYSKSTKAFNGGVFKPDAMSPTTLSPVSGYSATVKSEKRRRWVALGLWSPGGKSSTAQVDIYSMVMAPGFDEGELQAILENDGKLFGMNETWYQKDGTTVYDLSEAQYDSAKDTAVIWNTYLFGSTLKQNATARSSSRYAARFTGADNKQQVNVMSLQHTPSTAGGICAASSQCPICWTYKKYNQ